MKVYVPHKFNAGARLDPRALNENALALYAAAQQVLDQRYNYFQFVLDFGPYASSDDSGEVQRSIEAPFQYEIIESHLFVHDSSAQTLVLECSADGWVDLSIDVTSDNDGYSQQIQQQSVLVSEDTQIDFTMDPPSSDVDRVYAIIKCRYDTFTGLSVPTPPQVASGESISATKWNTWFTSMEELITDSDSSASGDLELNYPKRRGIEVVSFRNVDPSTVALFASPPASTTRFVFNGGTRVLQGVSLGWFSGDVGSAASVGASVWDYGNDELKTAISTSTGGGAEGFPQFATTASVPNDTLIDDPDDDDLGIIPWTTTDEINALETLYVVLYWEG